MAFKSHYNVYPPSSTTKYPDEWEIRDDRDSRVIATCKTEKGIQALLPAVRRTAREQSQAERAYQRNKESGYLYR